jgi:hypothetical protein
MAQVRSCARQRRESEHCRRAALLSIDKHRSLH